MSRTDAHRPWWTRTPDELVSLAARARQRAHMWATWRAEWNQLEEGDYSAAVARQCPYCLYDDCPVCGARPPRGYGRALMALPDRRSGKQDLRAAVRVANSAGVLECDCLEEGCWDCADDLTPPDPRRLRPGQLAHWYW